MLLLVGNVAVKAQTDVKFDENVRYSQWVLDSRLGDFYGNTNIMGFATYNRDLTVKSSFPTWKKGDLSGNKTIALDYVAGLVAKATLEAAILYKDYDWSMPWFKSVESYANHGGVSVPTGGGSLDDLNGAKMYFGLKTLAEGKFKSIAESTTASNAATQLGKALTGLGAHNTGYSFDTGTTVNSVDVGGGWFHKGTYTNQMWLDGQYMGPALLAQLINDYSEYSSIARSVDADWDLIAKQFTIVWNMCWDESAELLYHAFSSEKNNTWAGDAEIWTTRGTDTSNWTGLSSGGHSAAFWGRAEGWYFLALVDVLEQMPETNANYATLKGYLDKLAAGIKKRQNTTNGCWYQLIGKAAGYSAQYYNGKSYTAKSNYPESSCTAIFTAAYLKAMRLGLLDRATYEETAKSGYKGLVETFLKQKDDGTVVLYGCSRSAGLGTTAVGNEKFRDGSNAYYLLGYDVTPTPEKTEEPNTVVKEPAYTEGKVLGAFILAATEYERQYTNVTNKLVKIGTDLPSTAEENTPLKVVVADAENSNVAYQWYKGTYNNSTAITEATSAEYTPAESGTYYCKITVTSNVTRSTDSYSLMSSETVVGASSTDDNTGDNTGDNTTTTKYEIWFAGTEDANTNNKTQSTFFGNLATGTKGKDSNTINIGGVDYTVTNAVETSTSITFTIDEGQTGNLSMFVSSSGASKRTITLTKTGDTAGTSKDVSGTILKRVDFSGLTSGTYTLSFGNKNVHIGLLAMELVGSSAPVTTYTVTYNLNGHGDAIAAEENVTTLPATLPTPTATGYTFEGWYLDETLTTKATDGAEIKGNTILYAKWTQNTYTVTYNINGHGAAIDALTNVTTLPATLPIPTATGYTFEGWYLDEALTNKATAGAEIEDNTILYAKWTPNTVVTDGLIEEFAMSSKREDGSWYGDIGTEIKVSGVVYRDAGYMKLAKETGINSLYVPQGYTVSKIVLTVKSSSKSDPTEIEVGGMKQTVSTSVSDIEYDITDVEGAATITIQNTGARDAELTGIKVYGTAPQVGDYTITYVTKIGEEPAQQEKVSVLKAEYLPELSVDGYVFGGWYTDEACTEENKAVEGTVLNSDITLYAKWTVSETKKAIVLKYITTDGKTVFEGTSLTIGNFTSPTLKAYVANADGTASDEDVTDAIKAEVTYLSDVEDVATVSKDGVITIKDNATGGAKVYAKFAGNDNYAAAETFFNIIITSGYSYKVESGNSAPKIRDTHDIKDGDGKELLKITFGGWNLNSNTYNVPGSSTAKKDSWSSAKTEKGIASIDGYSYFFQGANDAKDEAIGEGEFYGSTRYGWFVPRDKEAEGTAGGTHPFTLPVRGSYITLEPTVNGTLTVYILQNGAWNTDKNYKIIKGEFRTHSFHVVNQRGLPVKYFSQNGYSVTTKQTVEDGYTCDLTKINDPVDNNSTNIALWEEFRTKFDEDMQKTIETNWNNGINGAQTIIELDDHSFLAIQKGIVKYTFHVMAKETYYLFSNFSKMGFSGVNFIPDTKQPDVINYPVLELSDTEKYVAPEKKSDGFYVAGNKCFEVDSSTPIGGKEVLAKVPQFAKITVNRTFKANQWTTISLPFNIMGSRVEEIFGTGTEIIMLDNATVCNGAARLHFIYHEIQNILPGYPYLIKPTKDVNGFEITNKYINPEMAQVDMDCGDYVAKAVAGYSTGALTNTANDKSGYSVQYGENDIFVSDGDGKLYVSAGNSFGKGYRSYIAKKQGTQAAKSISMSYSGVDDSDYNIPTEIKFVELAPEAVKALGFSGVYNLNGQYVGDTTENLPAGVYIANGRKIVIK